MRRIFGSFFVLLAWLPLRATQPPLRFEPVRGLSQNTVYSILKDRQGFLWIATADGLNRYDGVEMKYYKPAAEGRSGSYINRMIRSSLLQDDSGFIWFSSGAGLFTYDTRRDYFQRRPVPNRAGTGYLALEPLLLDGDRFWGSDIGRGIVELDRRTGASKTFEASIGERSWSFLKCQRDSGGNFWCLAGRGILYFERGKKTWQLFYPDRSISFAAFTGPEQIFIADGRLYASRNPGGPLRPLAVKGLQGQAYFRASCTDRYGNLWVGDESGSVYCRKSGEDFFEWRGNINPDEGGSRYPVYSLFADENDILWVGADVLGLLRTSVRPSAFHSYPQPEQRRAAGGLFIHSIWEEGPDIWLGTFRKGLWKLNRETGRAEPVAVPGTGDPFTTTYTLVRGDGRGKLWLAPTGNKLFLWERGQRLTKLDLPKPEELHNEHTQTLCMTGRNDTLFFSTFWGIYAVTRVPDGYRAVRLPGPGSGYYYDIYFDPMGRTWLATDNGVVLKKDLYSENRPEAGTSWLFYATGIKSFSPDTANGLLWICTTSGLIAYHLKTDTYRVFTEADGMNNSYVYGALVRDRELWLSTNKGLCRARITGFMSGGLPNLSFTHFHIHDGLASEEFNTGAFHRGGSGAFYFGGIEGITWFRPGEIRSSETAPRIVLTGLLVNEERPDSLLSPEYVRELNLPYHRNNLFFRFRGIEYVNPENVKYAYRLEGWDKEWIQTGTLNQVRYNGLPPGDYRFRIRATNGAGAWGPEEYSVRVTIRPPFWKTRWFLAGIGLLLLGSVIGLTRYISQRRLKKRVAALEAQRQLDLERQRISREMHDDIGSGLTQIALMSESARRKSTADEKELTDIGETSRRLVGSMNEIIWSLNPENKTLAQLAAYLREQLHRQLEYAGLDYSIEFPEGGEHVFLRNEQRRNLLLVMREIVNNAIKYSGARRLVIRAAWPDHAIEVEVADDGKGFDPATVRSGNGLRNIRHRVEELGGTLELDTAPGKGCRYRFRVPV